MTKSNSTDAIITFVGDHGGSCSCRILGIFDLEYSKYALLRKMDGDQWEQLVVMRIIPSDDPVRFEFIDDDTEFDHVVEEIEFRVDIPMRRTNLGRHVF